MSSRGGADLRPVDAMRKRGTKPDYRNREPRLYNIRLGEEYLHADVGSNAA